MIYDCFPFFNELDVLEIRLNTLNDVVDKFVLVEAAFTHTGLPKGFIFEENKDRYSKFLGKIIHIKLAEKPELPPGGTKKEHRWFLENYQRNQIIQGLTSAKPDDTIMISDCDEIPDPAIVKKLPGLRGVSHFTPRAYYFYLNLRNYSAPFFGLGTKALSYAAFQDYRTYQCFPYAEYVPREYNAFPSATMVRHVDSNRRFKAGWHFSYVGGVNAIRRKLNAIVEGGDSQLANISAAEFELILLQNNDILGNGDKFFPEPLDNGFPKCLTDNSANYSRLLLPTTREDFSKSYSNRLKARIKGLMAHCRQDYIFRLLGQIRRKIRRSFTNKPQS